MKAQAAQSLKDYFVQVRLEIADPPQLRISYTWIPWTKQLPSVLMLRGHLWKITAIYKRFLLHRRYWEVDDKKDESHIPLVIAIQE